MSVLGDLSRVFEVGPVFRAENSFVFFIFFATDNFRQIVTLLNLLDSILKWRSRNITMRFWMLLVTV